MSMVLALESYLVLSSLGFLSCSLSFIRNLISIVNSWVEVTYALQKSFPTSLLSDNAKMSRPEIS